MTMNKQKGKGNMYDWVETWNPVGGECPHSCSYCYRNDMIRFPQIAKKYSGKPRFVNTPIPKTDRVIFVCSMTDLFAEEMPDKIIEEVLTRCWEEQNNVYLFQTKNPKRLLNFVINDKIPHGSIIGTTIETTNFTLDISNAPSPLERYSEMCLLEFYNEFKRMVSIEPVMDFDVKTMIKWMNKIKPNFVSIGADSKNHNLSEPSPEKVNELIKELEKFTEVKVKSNLKRLTK